MLGGISQHHFHFRRLQGVKTEDVSSKKPMQKVLRYVRLGLVLKTEY